MASGTAVKSKKKKKSPPKNKAPRKEAENTNPVTDQPPEQAAAAEDGQNNETAISVKPVTLGGEDAPQATGAADDPETPSPKRKYFCPREPIPPELRVEGMDLDAFGCGSEKNLAIAAAMHSLCNIRRLEIFSFCDGTMTVNDMADRLSLYQSSVSNHLALLRSANMVEQVRIGRSVIYRATEFGLKCMAAARSILEAL